MKWHTYEIMTPGPYCVSPTTPLEEVVRNFQIKNISAAPVLDSGGEIIGLISLRDVALARPEQLVKEVMSSPAVVIDHAATIPTVLNTFKSNKMHRLVVVHNQRPIGIVSLVDLLEPMIEAYGYPNFM